MLVEETQAQASSATAQAHALLQDRVVATYLIETAFSLEYAAEVIAGEQSCGTFVAVPGETAALKDRHGARVISIKPLGAVSAPSLEGATAPHSARVASRYERGEVTISFPFHNIGPSIPNLLTTVAGNLYELQQVSGLRLVDLDLPASFAKRYPGPAFGIEGTRRLAGVDGRPLIGTIIKPSIGLMPDEIRPLIRDLACAGLDFAKDDELNGNAPYAPLAERVAVVMDEINRAADKTGKKMMYAFNITGDVDDLRRGHDLVRDAGGTCVMVAINSVGFAGLSYLRQHCELPIHGHRAMYGALARYPMLGIGFTAYQKICRLAGVDHLHVSGLGSKFYQSDEEVSQSILDCLTPLYGDYRVMPAVSSAQWAGSAVDTYARTDTIDLLHLAGGGIIAHPGGIAEGVRSMQQGWEAAMAGIEIGDYAATHSELKAAIEKFVV
ncbi:ribulose-bisphosphate carboxylase large chain [Modicisalibacter muralis]|uniref:Ribulose-bisphosphate carboxylase large chain n=1 Tax=Modicisalibacter muralis TaxID=119000 RepID=A0A1G9M741_9GAMM|nr:ribulose-bisphosphate carboxylase large subunit family protein [Halomonas muralis]SDL69944.1 ribulose-bisphosphate carboxylase large chain [Halomonas muralis]